MVKMKETHGNMRRRDAGKNLECMLEFILDISGSNTCHTKLHFQRKMQEMHSNIHRTDKHTPWNTFTSPCAEKPPKHLTHLKECFLQQNSEEWLLTFFFIWQLLTVSLSLFLSSLSLLQTSKEVINYFFHFLSTPARPCLLFLLFFLSFALVLTPIFLKRS